MKFTTTRKELLTALEKVKPALSQKSIIPALDHIHLSLEDGIMTLTGCDTEVTLTATMNAEGYNGAWCPLGSLFFETVKALPEGDLMVYQRSEQALEIKAKTGVYTIPTILASDYPKPEYADWEIVATLPVDTFGDALYHTVPFMDTNDLKPSTYGIGMDFTGEEIKIMGASHAALAVFRIDSCEFTSLPKTMVLPYRPAQVLKSVLPEKGAVEFSVSSSAIRFASEGWTFQSQIHDTQFIDCSGVFQHVSKNEPAFTGSKAELLSALKRARLYKDKVEPVGVFRFGEALKIETSDSIYGSKIEETVEANGNYPDLKMLFNLDLFHSAISVLGGDEVEIKTLSEKDPEVIVSPHYEHTSLIIGASVNKAKQ